MWRRQCLFLGLLGSSLFSYDLLGYRLGCGFRARLLGSILWIDCGLERRTRGELRQLGGSNFDLFASAWIHAVASWTSMQLERKIGRAHV